MGVPAFYKWLSRKYPKIITDVVEEVPLFVDGVELPVDSSQPNPNGIEFDNLYLDMNGIIHPCFHPEDRPPPATMEEVFQNIFDYMDRLFAMVRPRHLLYMAIDGVAPRAKMNQQRSRRFRAAQERKEQEEMERKLREEWENQGLKLPAETAGEAFDSNVITPGTPFMANLSIALQYYVHQRMNTESAWKNIKVILSDANSPGEGEHKIMEFIRLQRGLPTFNRNTKHVLYGLDADLIMLALATHEPHFFILREVVFTGTKEKTQEEKILEAMEKAVEQEEDPESKKKAQIAKKPFQFVRIGVLREYLVHEMKVVGKSTFEQDFEKYIDDFVFMCFFVGNDFLPHMPTLEIREGAIDLLMITYRNSLNKLGGYLVQDGKVNMKRMALFLHEIGTHEDAIFAKRSRLDAKHKRRRQQERNEKAALEESGLIKKIRRDESNHPMNGGPRNLPGTRGAMSSNMDAAAKLREKFNKQSSSDGKTKMGNTDMSKLLMNPEKAQENQEKYEEDLLRKHREQFRQEVKTKWKDMQVLSEEITDSDEVRLGEAGWKERYYSKKFGCDLRKHGREEYDALRRDVCKSFVEGLVWTLQYYYQGCSSWKWFFKYYYAPFASDIAEFCPESVEFELGEPFKPFNQLMGVLPAASSHCLPEAYRKLMVDPSSSIRDFYPETFKIDMEGKRFAWQGVALLPFIDEKRLLAAVEEVEKTLVAEEARRNSFLDEVLFVTMANALSPQIYVFYDKYAETEGEERSVVMEKIEPSETIGVNGFLKLCAGKEACPSTFTSPLASLSDVEDSEVLTTLFKNPELHPHIPRLLDGVILDPPTVTEADFEPTRKMWHEMNTLPRNESGSPYPDSRKRHFESSAGHMAYAAHQQKGHRSDNYNNQYSGGGYGQAPYSEDRYHGHRQRHNYNATPYRNSNHGYGGHRNDMHHDGAYGRNPYMSQSSYTRTQEMHQGYGGRGRGYNSNSSRSPHNPYQRHGSSTTPERQSYQGRVGHSTYGRSDAPDAHQYTPIAPNPYSLNQPVDTPKSRPFDPRRGRGRHNRFP